ncbi:hypothetical protein PIB30_051357 [Stylosanthes scabra]|uniref:Uncharacterized protein n=1 Tax=Stylosanthes scabra TaxID=79078 RepID=A0ABU6YGG9_9FABA|nr:hypothetical protein [Stylosanthes scabra]
MALEPCHLDLYSSSYDPISVKRSGLTALGELNTTLTLAPSVENSYSRDKKRGAGDLSRRWKTKSQSTTKEECENSHPQPTPEKEVNQRNQTIQQLETATLRETNSRSCNRLGSSEKSRRARKETASRPR